ncbi:MAG: AmmeMemoRadiSam system protein B [Candidatus Rokubacteria bacterium]|nr:AmmeMemoRadiSam system protein B [Candidatus Rokubacteria bacterium]
MTDVTPRLRSVEVLTVDHDGRRFLALRDPAGYTPAVLLLPLDLLEVVSLLDGEHTLVDIQAAIMRHTGELVYQADLEALVATLDEHGFMESTRFEEHRAAVDRGFLDAATRPATHAGGAYPGEAEELRRTMEAFFAPPAGPGPIEWRDSSSPRVTAVIAPHIDFHRGGPAYAWAYHDLAERSDADLFVVLGTCHAGMRDPFALTRKGYETPLGTLPVDVDFVEALAGRARQDCFGSELAHRAEHSIEFQAVFLRHLFGARREIAIVPVLTSFAQEALAAGSRADADPRVGRFLDALLETVAASGRRVGFIAGADLAHVGPRFGDGEPVSPPALAALDREDRALLRAVEAGDAEGFFEAVARDGDRRRICGLSPIYTLLRALGGAKGRLRHYGQWPDPQGVVTFASVVF